MSPMIISIGLGIAILVGSLSVYYLGNGNIVEKVAEVVADDAIQAETGIKPAINFDIATPAPAAPAAQPTTSK